MARQTDELVVRDRGGMQRNIENLRQVFTPNGLQLLSRKAGRSADPVQAWLTLTDAADHNIITTAPPPGAYWAVDTVIFDTNVDTTLVIKDEVGNVIVRRTLAAGGSTIVSCDEAFHIAQAGKKIVATQTNSSSPSVNVFVSVHAEYWLPDTSRMNEWIVYPGDNTWKDDPAKVFALVDTDPVSNWLGDGPNTPYFTTSDSTKAPTIKTVSGKKCLSFDATNDAVSASFPLKAPFTIGIAGVLRATTAQHIILGNPSGTVVLYRGMFTGGTLHYSDGTTDSNTAFVWVAGDNFTGVIRHDGTNVDVWMNDAQILAPVASAFVNLGGLTLGNTPAIGDPSTYAPLDVYAVIVAPYAFTDSKLHRLNARLVSAMS